LDPQLEAQLIRRACQHDERAFLELYETYDPDLRGFIRSKVTSEEDVEDLDQATWAYVWGNMHNHDPRRRSLGGYLEYMADKMMKRYWKEGKDNREIPVSRLRTMEGEDHGGGFFERRPSPQPSPEEALQTKEDDVRRWWLYQRFLEVTFSLEEYPHKLIVFGFNKLFTSWSPRRIVGELSDVPLGRLCRRLEEDYVASSRWHEEDDYILREHFGPLRERMEMRVKEVIKPDDHEAWTRWRRILDEQVGRTTLRDYYHGCPSANVSNWIYRVKERAKKRLTEVLREGSREYTEG